MELTTKNTMTRDEFMKQVGLGFGAIMLMNCVSGCSASDTIPTPQPGTGAAVDFTVNVAGTNLASKGGYLVKNNVIIAHTAADTFIAVSSACTHEGTEVQFRNEVFYCPNHGSEFKQDGSVQKSPAAKSLTKYSTSYNASAGTVRVFA